MAHIDLAELTEWLREAGVIARGYFNAVDGARKADNSYVTRADTEIERYLVARLAARYPTFGILGEEQTSTALTNEYVWALDPLDGTAGFVNGLPIWGPALGLLHRGVPVAGIIHLPLLDDTYTAAIDGPALRNGQPIAVAPPRPYDGEDWMTVPANCHRQLDIGFVGKTRSLGSTAASICYAARGSAAIALVALSGIWDIAAAFAILRAAGGIAQTLDGQRVDDRSVLDNPRVKGALICGAPHHIAQILPTIRERKLVDRR